MNTLNEKALNVSTKADFIEFLELLISDLKANPDEWENKDLPSYLGAVTSWTEDMEGFYQNFNLPIPENADWQTFAAILLAAKMYE
jgi:hypothetical protein